LSSGPQKESDRDPDPSWTLALPQLRDPPQAAQTGNERNGRAKGVGEKRHPRKKEKRNSVEHEQSGKGAAE
jgi:hypothetical protein